jgi:hypothetical protein
MENKPSESSLYQILDTIHVKTLYIETVVNGKQQHDTIELVDCNFDIFLSVQRDSTAPCLKITRTGFFTLHAENVKSFNSILNKADWHQKNTLMGRPFGLCFDKKVIGNCGLTTCEFKEQGSITYHFQCAFVEVDNFLF